MGHTLATYSQSHHLIHVNLTHQNWSRNVVIFTTQQEIVVRYNSSIKMFSLSEYLCPYHCYPDSKVTHTTAALKGGASTDTKTDMELWHFNIEINENCFTVGGLPQVAIRGSVVYAWPGVQNKHLTWSPPALFKQSTQVQVLCTFLKSDLYRARKKSQQSYQDNWQGGHV